MTTFKNCNKKCFKDIKSGDTVYKVCTYEFKTRIIKKTVETVYNNCNSLKIHFKCADSKYYSNIFGAINPDVSIHKCKYPYSNKTYLCTNIEDAKEACIMLANEIISNAEKEIVKLTNRKKNWMLHITELNNDNYIIV